MIKKNGLIIGGYKAIGKTTLAKEYSNVIDLESSGYEYIIDDELKKLSVEERKGIESRKKNPDYPLNYYNKIIEESNKGKIVLFACKKEIVDLLNENDNKYYIVYPKEEMLDEIIERSKNRGNNERFVSRIKEVYKADYPNNSKNIIWLNKGEFLKEVLIKNKLLPRKSILDNVLETCKYVEENSKHVKINYPRLDEIIKSINITNNKHWLESNPQGILDMPPVDIINFLLILHTIGDYCFWGEPKWEIETETGKLDGSFAMIYLLIKRLKENKSFEMSKKEFKDYLKGNVDIPLIDKRYESLKEVNNYLKNNNFYEEIRPLTKDIDLLNYLVNTFSFLTDKSEYKGKTICFYKRAQLLTSDILYIRKLKENIEVDRSNIVGCADYKIPQVMHCYGILEFNNELEGLLENKTLIDKDSEMEVEIRANDIVVIDYIARKLNNKLDRMDINDYIWTLGQDKSKISKNYHRTLTDKY